jgi:hypothetical protein
MAEVLEVFHLPEKDGVAEVKVGSSRIEAGFDTQGPALLRGLLEALAEILLTDEVSHTFPEVSQLLINRCHGQFSVY